MQIFITVWYNPFIDFWKDDSNERKLAEIIRTSQGMHSNFNNLICCRLYSLYYAESRRYYTSHKHFQPCRCGCQHMWSNNRLELKTQICLLLPYCCCYLHCTYRTWNHRHFFFLISHFYTKAYRENKKRGIRYLFFLLYRKLLAMWAIYI